MSAARTPLAVHAEPDATTQDWIAVLAGALGALLATLDISITNSALPQIQGSIGATGTEGTWIGTGYLVSEVVMIPLTAWFSRMLGMRTLLLTCAILFTLFSIVCGASHDLSTMVIGRVGQGFFGGALIPTAQTIVRTRLPAHQMPLGMTLFGLIIVMGPLLGPLMGGWLTENASWQWCFLINIPVAGGLISLLLLGLPHQKANIHELVEADWPGIIGMSIGLSCLTIVLEEGQREQWFDSNWIRALTVLTVLGLGTLIITQFTSKRPVLKLRLLNNPTYASVILIVTIVGMVFYGILYVLPQFLSGVAGYNSFQSGRILALSGLPALALMPVLPRILRLGNIKLVVGFGMLCFAASCFIDIHLTPQSSGIDFVASQLLRGIGQMFSMMPLNQISVGAVSRSDTADAAGLFNMARNLGGTIGLALLGVFIDRRVESHADAIRETVNANSVMVQDRIAGQGALFAAQSGDPLLGQQQALTSLAGQIHQQAMVMTYSDCFWMLGIALVVMMPLLFLLRRPMPTRQPVVESH